MGYTVRITLPGTPILLFFGETYFKMIHTGQMAKQWGSNTTRAKEGL
jgi:hypothetical protein